MKFDPWRFLVFFATVLAIIFSVTQASAKAPLDQSGATAPQIGAGFSEAHVAAIEKIERQQMHMNFVYMFGGLKYQVPIAGCGIGLFAFLVIRHVRRKRWHKSNIEPLYFAALSASHHQGPYRHSS